MGFSSLTQRLVSFNRRKQGRERLARRRIEQFVTTETLESSKLLTGIPLIISKFQMVSDTGQAGDMITTDPRVQAVLNTPDVSGSDCRVEIDLSSDGIFELDLCSMVCV